MTDPDRLDVDEQRLIALEDELGDALVVREAVCSFLDELPGRLADIRAAIDAGDRAATQDRAHALGSPAAMLGAVAVRAATQRVQAAAASDDGAAGLDGLYAELESVCEPTAAALRTYLASPLPA